MLTEFLEALFVFLTVLMAAYLARHYIFTLKVLKGNKSAKQKVSFNNWSYQPKVSILIPARNEEGVIERLLQRITELTYPKEKLQVIVIDDASEDSTGKIVEQYAKDFSYITVVRRSKKGGRLQL